MQYRVSSEMGVWLYLELATLIDGTAPHGQRHCKLKNMGYYHLVYRVRVVSIVLYRTTMAWYFNGMDIIGGKLVFLLPEVSRLARLL
jgi:hypothetical protein